MNRIYIGTRAAGSLRRSAVVAATMVMASVALQAQTVSFAGAQSVVPFNGLYTSYGVAVDSTGNVFVADAGGSRVLEVSPSGVQTTVGNGWNNPQGVAVDNKGNVFIADYDGRVVEVSAAGVQTTILSGLQGLTNIAVDGAGDVFVSDGGQSLVLEITPGGVQTRVGTGLIYPTGVAVDGAGNVFIADSVLNIVAKVSAGGVQTTVASGLNGPFGLALDSRGNLFISDTWNDRVVEVPSGGGAQTTVATGLSLPLGVAVDGAGNVFIASARNARVVYVQTVSVNFGTVNVCPFGQTSPAPCSQTVTLNYDVTASGTLGSVKVLTQGTLNLDFTLASGSTCTGDLTAGSTCTVNVTFAPRAPGLRMGAVQLTNASGNVLATTFVRGIGQGPTIAFGPGTETTVGSGPSLPFGVAVDAAGNLFIADTGFNRVVKVSPSGTQTAVGSGLINPNGVAVDGAGDVFIAETSQVVKVSPDGTQTTVPTGGLNQALGVAVDAAGNVFIADRDNSRVLKVPANGGAQTTVGSGLSSPSGVAVDGTGDVFIADANANLVVKVSPDGKQTTVPTSGLNHPVSVALDAGGDVFIADTFNNRVVEVPSGGGAQTTVGTGLFDPRGVAVDGAGNVFIADASNDRVVEVNRSQLPALAFAATPIGSTSSDSPQSLTLESIGNAPLVFSGLMVGTNFAQVAGSGTPEDCTSTSSLAPGASCNLSISFTPESAGSLQGAAVLTDNALNGNPATQSIPLSGTGTQLNQIITFNSIPNQVLGATVALTASASSGLPVTFTSLTPSVCTASGTTATLVSVGTCTIQVMQAGNSTYQAAPMVSQSFSVRFVFTGFFQPVDNPPTVNVVQAGRAIPVIFSLGGNKGLNIVAAGSPVSNQVSCTSGAPTSNIEQTVTAGSSSLSYSATSNQYSYVWKTDRSWSGTCQQFSLTLTDGTTHSAIFHFN